MGRATDWQTTVTQALAAYDVLLFNPRRDDWDSSWVQSKDTAVFREQVEWELTALEQADLIAFYFDPTTQAPISLLELGLFGRTSQTVVCCPTGFWRKGNVDIVCERYGIPQADTLPDLIQYLQAHLPPPR